MNTLTLTNINAYQNGSKDFSTNFLRLEKKHRETVPLCELFLHKVSTFLLQNLVNNRNFAIFAPHLAYEVQ